MSPRKTPPESTEFATTRWSVVLGARDRGSKEARRALETLCRAYWYPLYAYIRRKGYPAEDAQDLTQSFFARIIEKDVLASVDRSRGKFRSFLLACLGNFLSNERDRARAKKRGGGARVLSIDGREGEDRYALEPADPVTPERLFERRWALTLLERAIDRLRRAEESAGRSDLFARLERCLGGAEPPPPYAELAAGLGMSEAAVKTAAHRLRGRFRESLRAEIAETVATPEDVDDEIRGLFEALE